MAIKTVTTAATTTKRSQTSGVLLLFRTTVIVAIMANLCLSVDALRCHQCNTHLNEDCHLLRLTTPRAPRDNQFLKECDDNAGIEPFCRKTSVTIEVTGEHRVVRGCGWIPEEISEPFNGCYTADNEGYLQTICTCNEDGCNAATPRAPTRWLIGAGGAGLLLAAWVGRSAAAN